MQELPYPMDDSAVPFVLQAKLLHFSNGCSDCFREKTAILNPGDKAERGE